MIEMIIIDFLVYIMVCISVLFDVELLGLAAIGIYVLLAAMAIIRSMIYSKKTFVCLDCGNETKLKWTYLLSIYRNWGFPSTQQIIKIDDNSYKMICVRCNHCGAMKVMLK